MKENRSVMIPGETLEVIEPEGTGSGMTVAEGNPEEQLAILEKRAELAPRFKKAIETILINQTYTKDWTVQGEGDKARACLSSAGAERVGRNFPIRFYDVKSRKEEFADAAGAGYRYVFSGYASMGDRIAYGEGNFSTRDEFLGKKDGEWRPLEDINEGDVRSAAMHTFQGNCIKQLLGLRGLPVAEYNRIMGELGQDAKATPEVRRGSGTDGGTSTDDSANQKKLIEDLLVLANGGFTVAKDEKGYWHPIPISESDERKPTEIANDICILISGFTSKRDKDESGNPKQIKGKSAKDLKGNWLAGVLKTSSRLRAEAEKMAKAE